MLCRLLALLEDVNDVVGEVRATISVVYHQQAVLCRGHQVVIGGQEGCLIVYQPARSSQIVHAAVKAKARCAFLLFLLSMSVVYNLSFG